mgnify:CR=1 FL=1
MRRIIFIFLSISLAVHLSATTTLSDAEKINALVAHFIQDEVNKIPKPPEIDKVVKDEFETTNEFKQRKNKLVKEHDYQMLIYNKKIRTMELEYEEEALKEALSIIYGLPEILSLNYNADEKQFNVNYTFKNLKNRQGLLKVTIPREYAREFKSDFDKIVTVYPEFVLDNREVVLSRFIFNYKNSQFYANVTNNNSLINNIILSVNSSISEKELSKLNETHLLDENGKADDIPVLLNKVLEKKIDKKKWLFVIGIEEYKYTDDIVYAKNSAQLFEKTLKKVYGISKNNTYLLINDNASYAQIKRKLLRMINNVKSGDSIYFYYNGHGIPIPNNNNEPYILPYDMEPEFIQEESFLKLSNIYSLLSKSQASKVVVFVDSCFSGGVDGKNILKGVASSRLVPKEIDIDDKKMVVMSAGRKTQFSNAYETKGHRLFTYYLMKSMLSGEDKISEIYKNLYQNVKDATIQEYGPLRLQEPTLKGNDKISL